MKTVVVYQSSTGFTKQYAQWIAEELNCELVDIKKMPKNKVNEYDHIIFGGWIMGNMIMGLNKITNLNPKKLTIFAVGSTPYSEELLATIKNENHIEDKPFYYYVGGFHYDKLKLPVRLMLKMVKKSALKKEQKTAQDEYMIKVLGTSFDHSDKGSIKGLVEIVKA